MENEQGHPDFEAIKQVSPYGAEYWSARELSKLLGYSRWENFEIAVKRGITSCKQIGQDPTNHFRDITIMTTIGSGAKRQIKDYVLSRFACYLIAQNGDPSKTEIAQAQAYFAVSTRAFEIHQLREEQQERLRLREQITENNKALADAAIKAGVLTKNFGVFQNAGYKGLYGGMNVEEIKRKKSIGEKEDVLDRMGRSELAANDFRITQTEEKLRNDQVIGQTKAIETHFEVGQKVRKAIKDIGGTMPEEIPSEPSIKPLLDEKKRKNKQLEAQKKRLESLEEDDNNPSQGSLF
jgi:DNA-damage-inducible protein D